MMSKTDPRIFLMMEIENRRRFESLRYFRPHEKQKEWLLCGKRNAWALGGNRTGKTECGAVKAIIYALGDSIQRYMDDWPKDLQEQFRSLVKRFGGKPTRGWICSESFEVQRDVTQKKLFGDPDTGRPGLLPKGEIRDISYRAKDVVDLVVLKNGSTIGFKSYDQGRDKFQGTSQHWIWMDEEPPKDIYSECLMRLMDTSGDLFATMTPLQGLTFVYDDIFLNNQKPKEKQDTEVFCLFMSWEDNPYLSREEIKRLEATLNEVEVEARKHGRFIMPGKNVLNMQAIMDMQEKCYPGERGWLKWIAGEEEKAVYFEPDPQGEFEVWFHPDSQHEYITPADVAEGLEHGDFSVCGVINRHELRLDAVWHGHIDADIFAKKIWMLSVYYNQAKAAPERNNHGLTTISFLKRKYRNIYKEVVVDKMSDERREVLGWRTTPKTRPLMVDALKQAIRSRALTCYYKRFIDESWNFIRDKNGKEQAREGSWDDVIMMMAIGCYLHQTMPMQNSKSNGFLAGGFSKGKQRIDFDRETDDDDDETNISFMGR